MNKNSNTYIIIYSTVMVVVVALVLAFASLSLQGRQNANEENEMKGALLSSIGVNIVPEKGADKTQFINDQYDKYIKNGFAVKEDGSVVDGANAFDILKNLKSEYDKPASERELPVFESVDEQGVVKYIIPVRGSGLWGAIWGYVALNEDWNTI